MNQILFLLLTLISSTIYADNQKDIERLLQSDSEPFGVVFEIVESSHQDLSWALPRIQQYSKQLRKKFPDLDIAVVSHGSEQFGLVSSEIKKNTKIDSLVQTLIKNDAIKVHVCGGHASWYDVKAEDYPDYIDFSPSGPTEISNYVEMGYKLIRLNY